MYNIATIYRFDTPFLDIQKERYKLIYLRRKIEKYLEFEAITFKKEIKDIGNYNCVLLNLGKNIGKIEFYYRNENITEYYLPIFKLNIFLDSRFVYKHPSKKKIVLFLNNIFECFDGLNEKEFLIDLDNNIYYEYGLLKRKKIPDYDFSDIEKIRRIFEKKEGIVLLKTFIEEFSSKDFELTIDKSRYYHILHSIFLYFIYLIFIMSQNIKRTKETIKEIESIKERGVYESQVDLVRKRLSYVKDLELDTFKRYKNRLELFFKLF